MCDTEAGYEGIKTTELDTLKAENAMYREALELISSGEFAIPQGVSAIHEAQNIAAAALEKGE